MSYNFIISIYITHSAFVILNDSINSISLFYILKSKHATKHIAESKLE